MESNQNMPHSVPSIQHNENYVLLVGEGDFSFASSFIQKTKHHVIATCLTSLEKLTERQCSNIKLIEKFGGAVYTDVDATHLATNPNIKMCRFSIIIFNFPHVSGKMNIGKNKALLENFFSSAKEVLAVKGEIWVTLCKGQGGTPVDECQREWNNTWQITVLAASSNFILHQVKHFDAEDYPAYKCSGHRGLEKSFDIKGAMTHIFVKGQTIREIVAFDLKSLISFSRKLLKHEVYISDSVYYTEKLKKTLSSEHPIIKVISFVMEEARKNNDKLHIISVSEPTSVVVENKLDSSDSQFLIEKANIGLVPLLHRNIDDNIIETCKKQLDDGMQTIVVNGTISIHLKVSLTTQPVYHEVIFISRNEAEIISTVQSIISSVLLLQPNTTLDDGSLEHLGNDINLTEHLAEIESSLNIPDILQSNTVELPKTIQNSKISHTHASIPLIENDEKLYSIYVMYDIFYSESHALFHNLVLNISREKAKSRNCTLEVGSIYRISDLICIVLNIDHICLLKYHVLDWRILWSNLAYYSKDFYKGKLYELYRSPSLFSPVYIHDTSFWISENFDENIFILLVRELVGDLVSDIILLDSYYNRQIKRNSRCYRFLYQSCDQPLSKDFARDIHTRVVRQTLQKTLDINLR